MGLWMRRKREREPGVVLNANTGYLYYYQPKDRCSNCTLWDRELGGKGLCMKSHKITWFNSICRFFRRKDEY